jgi:predicted HTH transcriptional regulator
MDSRDLLSRLKNAEDNFVERKTHSDSRDWLKTIVAFANSIPNDEFGILFIGVRNNGSLENAVDWDNLQKTLNQKLASAYPQLNIHVKWFRIVGENVLQ